MSHTETVYLVDDDQPLRESLAMMLGTAGFTVRAFASGREFLDGCPPGARGCLVLDLRMPGMNGLELQRALVERGDSLPVIFLSAFGDVPTTVRAVKTGAVDFLEKPVPPEVLVARIREAIEQDRRESAAAELRARARTHYESLTPREREVMVLVTKGLANKEIAGHLGISPRTVENHRARVMEKMDAENIAELCSLAALCLPTAGDANPASPA